MWCRGINENFLHWIVIISVFWRKSVCVCVARNNVEEKLCKISPHLSLARTNCTSECIVMYFNPLFPKPPIVMLWLQIRSHFFLFIRILRASEHTAHFPIYLFKILYASNIMCFYPLYTQKTKSPTYRFTTPPKHIQKMWCVYCCMYIRIVFIWLALPFFFHFRITKLNSINTCKRYVCSTSVYTQ